MDEKIDVEAERGRDGRGVVLTLVSVPERRRLVREYGVHNAYVRDLRQLGTFPPQYITDFYRGSPIRFRMNKKAFERLLESPRAEALGGVNGFDIATNSEGLTWAEWVQASGRTPKKLSKEEIGVCTKAWRSGEDPTEHRI